MLTPTASRVLGPSDLDAALAVLAATRWPTSSSPSRVQAAGLDPRRLGGEMWGLRRTARSSSLCYAGANLVPVAPAPTPSRAFADRARRQGRRCSSIVGPAERPRRCGGCSSRTGARPATSAPTSR